jgi:TatA/E family protein of Tat protein translocase
MLNIGPQELIVVLIIALLVVGPSRLPELGRSIGKALREFRKVQDEVKDTFKFDLNEDPSPAPRPGGPRPYRPPTSDPKPDGGASAATVNGEASAPASSDEPDVSVKATPDGQTADAPAVEAPDDGSAPEPEPSA